VSDVTRRIKKHRNLQTGYSYSLPPQVGNRTPSAFQSTTARPTFLRECSEMRDSRAVIAVQCNYCQWLIVIRAHRNYRLISRFPPPSSSICIGSRRLCNSSLLSIRRISLKQGDYKASLHFLWLEWQLESPLQFPVECQGVGWGGRQLMCLRQQHIVFIGYE